MGDMGDEYSLYEAKAQLSAIVRRLREGGSPVVITVHGEPAAEIRAWQPMSADLDTRWAELERRGAIKSPKRTPAEVAWKPLVTRRGALARFLTERKKG